MNKLIAENEIIKKGKTYILKNDVSYGEFKKEYPNADKITGMTDKEVGKVLTNENKKEIWFISDEFYNKNYKYKFIDEMEKPKKVFLEKMLNHIKKNMDLIRENINENNESAESYKKKYDEYVKKVIHDKNEYDNQQCLYLVIKEKIETM